MVHAIPRGNLRVFEVVTQKVVTARIPTRAFRNSEEYLLIGRSLPQRCWATLAEQNVGFLVGVRRESVAVESDDTKYLSVLG